MKRLSILLMILFLSACGNGETESSEASNNEERTETGKVEKWSDEEIAEFEWEKRQSCERLKGKDNERALKICEEIEERETAAGNESDSDKENDETVSTDGQTAEEESDGKQNTEIEESAGNSAAEETVVQEFTLEQQQEMNQLFYEWAVERAKIGGMAVTEMYFSHGAAGRGDWYAMTPDGEVQTQDQENPGFNHFNIHAIGGVAFYQPASGDYGEDANAPFPGTAEGYSNLALRDTNIHKYMLADNGVVYELIGKKENMGFSSGFGEYDDEGTYGEWPPGREFEISGDQEAQQEWERILEMYQG